MLCGCADSQALTKEEFEGEGSQSSIDGMAAKEARLLRPLLPILLDYSEVPTHLLPASEVKKDQSLAYLAGIHTDHVKSESIIGSLMDLGMTARGGGLNASGVIKSKLPMHKV